MPDTLKPVLFVAFGDPKNDREAALPALEAEQKNIRSALKDVWALGSWAYVSGLNCTRAELVEQFNSDRVTIFHFGGHASPQSLLLPAETEGNQVVSGVLLEDFLARQKSLKVAFFNACSTERWAAALAESIPYVVATVSTVDDRMALDFASTFYAKLAADLTVEDAFAQAAAAVILQHEELKPPPEAAENDAVLSRYRRMSVEDDEPAAFPWILCRKPNLTRDEHTWSLSAGAKDPLIGLPLLDLPKYSLPERPYVSIKGHTEAEAPLFFGRRAEIRALYDWALDDLRLNGAGSPPILLFYGQSGAGKSSLLNAGLLPRLKNRCAVEYRRRSVDLLEDFYSAVGGSSDEAIEAWIKSDEPRLVILDQVEEAITHRTAKAEVGAAGADARDELTRFLARLTDLFVNAETGQLRSPQSKARLILSFRKEYVPEIRTPLVTALPELVTDVWLERLDGERVVEVIEGPVRTAALRDKYKITLENGFAEYVASRLNDPNSPIATVLQIVLNKLWDEATKNGGDPVYTRALYDGLSAMDNPLHGFYGEQLDRLYALEDGARYSDGIELDLLVEHTSDFGTSRRRTLAELRATYPKVSGLEQLIQKNKGLYLLAEPPREEGDETAEPATTLTHDTLAPVIRRDFALSLTAGARARRLLENRAREWADPRKAGTPLDAADLRTVRRGLAKMRALHEPEVRLLTASRRRARQNLAITASILAVLIGIGAYFAWDTIQQRRRADAEARTREALRLARDAKAVMTSQYDLAMLLSAVAYETDPKAFEVRDALLSIYQARPDAIAVLHPSAVTSLPGSMAFSPDGNLLAVTSGRQVELWDVKTRTRKWAADAGDVAKDGIDSVAISYDNALVAMGADRTVLIWRTADHSALPDWHVDDTFEGVTALDFSPDGGTLVAGDEDGIWHWNRKTGKTASTDPPLNYRFGSKDQQIMAVQVNPRNPRETATINFASEAKVNDKDLKGAADVSAALLLMQLGHLPPDFFSVAYSSNGAMLATSTGAGPIVVSRVGKAGEAVSGSNGEVIQEGSGRKFTGMALNDDGTLLSASATDGSIGVWNTTSTVALRPLTTGRWQGTSDVAFSRDGKLVAMRGAGGDVLLLDNTLRGLIQSTAVVNVERLAYSPDGTWVGLTGMTSNDRPTIALWNLQTSAAFDLPKSNAGEQDRGGYSLAFGPGGTAAVEKAGRAKGEVEVRPFDLKSRKWLPTLTDRIGKLPGKSDPVTCMASGHVALATAHGIVWRWDTGRQPASAMSPPVSAFSSVSDAIVVTRDGKYAAVSGEEGKALTVWNLDTCQGAMAQVKLPVRESEGTPQIFDMAESGQPGRGLLAVADQFRFSVWNVETGALVTAEDAGSSKNVITSLSLSGDGNLLAVGLENGQLKLWSVFDGRWIGQDVQGPIMDLSDETPLPVPAIASFSPDGRHLAGAGPKGALWRWELDVDPAAWRDRACRIAGRNLTPEEWALDIPDQPYYRVCATLPDGNPGAKSK
jgi:WD40 repeat protein